MRKSAKKQQPHVQTIQRTVTSRNPGRNVTQDNGNINKFWKGSRWFCCLVTFHYFLRSDTRKRLFGKLHFFPSI